MGNIPFASGTFGTLPGLVFCFFISFLSFPVAIVCIIGFIAVAIWIADEGEKIIKKKDPGCIVIDEIAGIMVTLVGIPFTFTSVVAGFFLFRFLDILKPFPIRYLERNIPGGAGIVLDDVAAGIVGNIILRLVL